MSAVDPVDTLKAIAHPLRLRILQVLAAGERNVGEIEAAAGIGQPALSQQLAVLRSAGLVGTRRQAKLVFYRAESDTLARTAALIGALAAPPPSTPPAEPAARAQGAANFARMS